MWVNVFSLVTKGIWCLFIIFRHLLNLHAYGVSLGNPSLYLYALYSVLHRTLSLSRK